MPTDADVSENTHPVTVFAPGTGMPLVGTGRLRRRTFHVALHDGRTLELALDAIDLHAGGASGSVLFLRSRRDGTTVTVDVPGFAAALGRAAEGALDAPLAAILASGRARVHWDRVAGIVLLVLALVAGAAALALPRVLRASVDAIPRAVDRQIGDAVLETVANDALLAHDPVLDEAAAALLARLDPHAEHDGFVYRVRVVKSADVNAFALPGGAIVICAGLLARAERPEAVAGVIAHEIAHVTERHALRALLANLGLVLGVQALVGDLDFLPRYAQDGALLAASRGFSRAEELEADTLGVATLIRARIDPRGLADVFRTLAGIPDSSMPGMLTWMSTHPEHGARIRNVERLARAGAGSRGPSAYVPFAGLDWARVRAAAEQVLARESTANE